MKKSQEGNTMFQLLLAIIYLAFISLGLPDSLLGSAWPAMYKELSVPVSYAGGISMIIAIGTIISSLQSDRLTRRFGTGKVTAFSVLMTAAALFGFSISHSYIALCLWAIPYGLGAGSVDASLNNYVALHYESRHMSWLHCMWGGGASLGPYVMGYALSGGQGWNMGYRYIALLQIALTVILLFSLPLWKQKQDVKAGDHSGDESNNPLSLPEIIHITWCKRSYGDIFLLLRFGTDNRAVGEQLSGAATRTVGRYSGWLCKPVFRGNYSRQGAEWIPYLKV